MDTSPDSLPDTRRQYNAWVAAENVEDFALRYCPPGFRRWSPLLIANTANASFSALVLEAIGAALLLSFGFQNAFWAMALALVINILAGIPIAYYAARHNIDADLITRGAGFGYVGSTVTSLVYAAFCFITFALQASIMAGALKLAFDIPLALGYLICSLVIIPIVFHGITALNRLQAWTLLPAAVLLGAPVLYVLITQPAALANVSSIAGAVSGHANFDPYFFGLAAGINVSLIAQIGEQADYLRFMPPKTPQNRLRWWVAVMFAGPGWYVLATLKHLIGMLLVSALLLAGVAAATTRDPVQMYYLVYQAMLGNPALALAAVTIYALIAQVRINVTNAYAGSLAWSNFFSRVTYSHPGRVVWLVFHIGVALLLMELGVLQALEKVLGLYANIAIAWIAAVVADLVINKPLGLSPPMVEFKRANLYDFNPVGFGAMLVAATVAITAFTGVWGPYAQAYSWLIALVTSFLLSPLLAWITGGKYYIARPDGLGLPLGEVLNCSVCSGAFVAHDCAQCPFHGGPICSLCCTLESACKDQCKPAAPFASRYEGLVGQIASWIWRRPLTPLATTRLSGFLATFTLLMLAVALCFGLIFWLREHTPVTRGPEAQMLIVILCVLTAPLAVGAWLIVLGREGRDLAELEAQEKNRRLEAEIVQRTLLERDLAAARDRAMSLERTKSDLLVSMSHEIRTPMNAIIGMAHLARKAAQDKRLIDYVQSIERAARNLHRILDDVLDFSKIEAGKLEIEQIEFDLGLVLENLMQLCAQQAGAKGLDLFVKIAPEVPCALVGDPLRLGQILLNFATNAVKFTEQGRIIVSVTLQERSDDGALLRFAVSDTGIGLTAAQSALLFETFAQAESGTTRKYGGSGLGLSICKRLALLMGGTVGVDSEPGRGSTFWASARFGLARNLVARPQATPALKGMPTLLVDDDADARTIYGDYLSGFGMQVQTADTAARALDLVANGARPELLLLDYRMEDLDGLALHERLRSLALEPRPRAIIMLTASTSPELRAAAEQAGFDAFLNKPIGPSALLDCIVELFGVGSARDDHAHLDGLEAAARVQLRGRRILLAEDNDINQQVAREILEDVGIEVSVAGNGIEALALVHEARLDARPYDLVLMDMQMPEMDGIAATQALRRDARNKALPIIAMTANAMEGARRACLDAGMNEHLSKPLNVPLLISSLMRWLPSAEAEADAPPSSALSVPAAPAPASALRDMPGLDTAAGLAHTGGSPRRYLDMLQRFQARHGDLPARAAAAMRAGDREAALRFAHTLTGLAATLGAHELRGLADAFEQTLQADQVDQAAWERQLPALEACVQRLLESISKGLAET